MDENELKNRLQHDAELFSKVFDEELCRRIKNEISGQRNLLYARKNHQFVLQYAVLICSSILIGIGIKVLYTHLSEEGSFNWIPCQ